MDLRLELQEFKGSFDMEKAVCNHGFFMMAPNLWNPKTKSLTRPLRLSDSSSTNVTISHQASQPFLEIKVHDIDNVSRVDEELIFQQVRRMLRLSDKDELQVTEFQKLHEGAKKSNFGRIFRSPSLFEDMVKTLLLCFNTWENSLRIASHLCKLQSKLAENSEDREPRKEIVENFPSAKEIASFKKELISEHCKLGYRDKWIHILANRIERGSLNLQKMESGEMEAEEIAKKVSNLKGFGLFATATVLMCIGHYHRVTCDTETLRLFGELHGKEKYSKKTLEKQAQSLYHRFSPFQCLAYWFDLIRNYEEKLGKLSELDPCEYIKVSGCSKKQRVDASAEPDRIKTKVCKPKKRKPTKFIAELMKTKPSKKKEPRKDYTCSLCKQAGHSCRTCPVLNA
ncbi:unnamed protein product [Microthlaspi erraticum]|uniref:HhH-GPD domain-containing protein n=1 Tax=Microthlaspi erraticum TaxID=1685480 RepID=A0A6D2LLS7_9BRAS|nr:unnamed protein product [Microthlaspi erraticum]